MRSQLADAFSEALADGPDSTEVLLRVRATIERRRRRQRHYRTGGVLGAVLLVLTVTAVAVSTIRAGDGAPAGTGDHIPVGEWKTTLRLGWVPDGLAAPMITGTAFAESILYPGMTAPRQTYLRVSLHPAGQVPEPSGQPVDVNGRQGYERSEPTRTIVVFPLPSGRWVDVEFGRGIPTGGPDNQPELRDTALRIAQSVDQTADTPLRTGFAPGYLPAGQHIVGVSTEVGMPAGFGRVYAEGPAGPPARSAPGIAGFLGGVDGQRGPGVSISIEPAKPALLPYATPIADIQGRPAYRLTGGQTIVVANFHGGMLTVAATAGTPQTTPPELLPEAELIKVAESVRWLG